MARNFFNRYVWRKGKAIFSIVTYYCDVCMGLCININNLYA